MIKRPLGRTGLNVSPLGLGTVKLGRNRGVKYPQGFELPDNRQAAELIALARDLGINLIDTAPAYGTSEQRLGELLAGQRRDWVICTKVGEEFDGEHSHFDFSAAHTRRSVERSLKRLQSDYLDLVLVHSDGRDSDIVRREGALEELERLKQQGLIRAFGVSTKTLEGGRLAAELSDLVMVTYNAREREQEPVIDRCRELGKGVLLKKALASGHLCLDGADPVQAGMDFIFAHPGVSSAIIGTINPQHLRDNVAKAERALAATKDGQT